MSVVRTAVVVMSLLALVQPASAKPRRGGDFDLVIEGEVQKPEVSVVISRENLNKKYVFVLNESFLPKVTDALRKPPF